MLMKLFSARSTSPGKCSFDNKNHLLIGDGDQLPGHQSLLLFIKFHVNSSPFVWFIWFLFWPGRCLCLSKAIIAVALQSHQTTWESSKKTSCWLTVGIMELCRRISPALVVAPQKPWNMIISSLFFRTVRFARDQPNGFIFSFSEISSRSQFSWWILDIYKGKQRETGATGVLRVHENVANSSCAPPPTTSAELIFLFLLPPEKHHKSLFFLQGCKSASWSLCKCGSIVCWITDQCHAFNGPPATNDRLLCDTYRKDFFHQSLKDVTQLTNAPVLSVEIAFESVAVFIITYLLIGFVLIIFLHGSCSSPFSQFVFLPHIYSSGLREVFEWIANARREHCKSKSILPFH